MKQEKVSMSPLKRFALITISIVVGTFVLGGLTAIIYRDKVKNLVLQSLNQNLTAKIEVEDISFSVLRNFPYASVEFTNIKAGEAKGFITTGTVMNAHSLSLLFNLAGIFSDNYRLKRIVLEDATLNLQVDVNGNVNYNIWKSDSTSGGKFDLELQQVTFKNVNVLYYNTLKSQDISFLINEGELTGNFDSNQYALTSSGKLENASVIIDNISYLSEIDGELQLTLNVDRNKGSYTFENSGLKLAGLHLQLKGNITDMDDHVMMDLALSSPKADLPSLLSLIPEKYRTGTGDYNYSGDVEFNGSFKGRSDASHSPLIAFSFVSKHANLNPKGTPYHLKNLNGKGFFTNRKNKAHPVTYLKLENFTGTLEGKPIRANVEIENFAKPRLSISAEFEADLKALSNFFKPDTLESISGLAMIDATFNGISGEKSTYRSSGNIRFSNVDFHLKKKPVDFRNFNGMLHLEGNDLVVEELTGQAGGSDFRLSGSFHNLFAWLMAENQSLNITASLQSKNLHLDELMAKEIETSPSHEDTVYRLNFSEKIRLDLDVSIGQLQFRKFMASDLNGTVALENKKLITRELDFNTSDGSVKLKGSIDNQLSDSLKISYDAMINNLDINKLFYEMGNFGQEVIVDKNLKGRVSAQVVFKSSWSNKLELNENSIYARSNITIENGELINFTPLLALSRFLKGTDLKTVKFSTLTNIIEIKDRKINIPLMEIKSSAIDITTSGKHSFDNIVDYKLRLYLSQIMGRKVREQNTEFGTIEDDGVGRPMVYLSMKGKASDPKFTWDRASVERKIEQEVKNESKTFKSILKEEFGKKDGISEQPQVKKKTEELQLEFEEDSDQ